MASFFWFEIPSIDIDRAEKFYQTIFDIKLTNMDNQGLKMRTFPVKDTSRKTGGAIVFHPKFYHPSTEHGILMYLDANPDVQIVLDRVEDAGGTIVFPKRLISPDYGYTAIIIDSEGNRIGLHSDPEA